ncbi:hypothetical protein KUCAC02_002290 [Chaenocephalus aceratus]|uniref:Uncharacterized protein n=1 Tax=Chaenocephalus aceratus TaxID=36190 RepID=A0ACB9XUS9_CHAAC|nr:hypothetical protein KUCAC02_002290 [Chaenocephalus aceratus]
MKDICLSSNEGSVSDKDYIPETASSSDGSSADEDCPPDSEANTDWDHLIATIRDSKPPHCKTAPTVSTKNCVEQQDTAATTSDKFQLHEHFIPDMASSSDNEPTTSNPQNLTTAVTESHYSERATIESVANPKDSSFTLNNYCYVCNKPQSKIARHFKKHEKEQPEIAEAFMFPKHSKERKRLLEKLRNKGNYHHNQETMQNQSGPLKLKPRRSNVSLDANKYVHCVYCKGMFVRKELWRHMRRCPSKTVSDTEATGRTKVLVLADIAESTFSQAISPGLWKILGNMKQDEVASVSRNDFLILQLAQSLYNNMVVIRQNSNISDRKSGNGKALNEREKQMFLCQFEDAVKPTTFTN